MPEVANPADICRAIERHVAARCGGPQSPGRSRRTGVPDSRWLNLTVELDHAVITCRVPRGAGAGAALALADEVTALFRGRMLGRLQFEAPSVDLDGRDPDGFRAVVTLPIRRGGAC